MRRGLMSAAVVLATLIAVSAAWAGDTPPDLVRRPTAAELRSVWPSDALAKGIGGKAVIRCQVSTQGALFGCQVVSETPPGRGFGGAAIAMTPQLLMRPATHDGVAVVSTVLIPVDFAAGAGQGVLTGSRIPGSATSQPVQSTSSSTPSSADLVVTSAPFVTAPTWADVVAAYPSQARLDKVGGHVAMNCLFGRQGRFSECEVISEEPRGYGFGEAARQLAHRFAVAPADAATLSGASTEIAVIFAPDMLTENAHLVADPTWTHLPASLAMAQAFPAAAAAAHVAVGHVALTCAVMEGGRLADCVVSRQEPEGLGFGAAALALAPDFQVSVWTAQGLPTVGGRVAVPIRYEAPQ